MSDTLLTGPWTQGEVPIPLVMQFMHNKLPINLTGYNRALFIYKRRGGTPVVKAATVTDEPGGRVTYVFKQADTAVPGEYEAEFSVDNGTNLFISQRVEYTIEPAIDPTSIPSIV